MSDSYETYLNNCISGTPPETFTYEFYNKEKAYRSLGRLTPQEFYRQHVRPLYDVDDKVLNYFLPTAAIGT